MGKPLLTDEMIERANRGEKISGPPLQDDEETKSYQHLHNILVIHVLETTVLVKIHLQSNRTNDS